MRPIDNFVVIDSCYGKFIVNRFCDFQADALIKTGKTHIEPELSVIRSILDTLPEGYLFVDGGANIGFVSVPACIEAAKKKGEVIAFEPQRMLFNALSGTIALNDFKNLTVKNVAVGETIGTAYIPDIDYSKICDFGTVQLSETATGKLVDVVSIDSLGLSRLDMLKLDVEGYEIAALKGARKSIEKFEPYCWVEHWKVGAKNIAKCFDGLNYKFFIINGLDMVCIPQSRFDKSPFKLVGTEIK